MYVDSPIKGSFAAAVHQVPLDSMQQQNLTVEDVLNA
jgi:hypothetical protein